MSDINRPARPYVSIQHQPWKAIYMTKTLISVLFFQLPFYAITQLLFRSARPHPDFTFAQAMVVRIVRFMGLLRRADWYSDRWTVEKLSKYTNAKSEPLGGLLAKAVWVPKLDGALQGEAGELEKRAGTRSVRTHGWWFAIPSSLDSHGNAAQWRELFDEKDAEKAAVASIKAAKGEQVLLYFHGGGYLERSAGPKSQTTAVPRQLIKKIEEHLAQGYEGDAKLLPRKAFSLEYRLSDKTSFSGILADAVSSWRYLVEDCEYEPENIYVGGDSAGGERFE
ncbi:hypothetical protein CBOM_07244 [Ceraceosorus bombacis]|uniref:Alpha/beta hydrolase fold-3 domain-containing protein n=1 Tax=Ceraceosorus bombacis TaxID=401625 RepID=A0A0P1B8L2_9BASI|nr:hypothetical protein CBOM_07244 [Ceraceosorus bombacis]